MAHEVALSEMATEARRRADMEFIPGTANENFINDDELYGYIRGSAREFWDLLIESDDDSNLKYKEYSTVAGIDLYDQPMDWYRDKAIDYVIDRDRTRELKNFLFIERNRFKFPSGGEPLLFRTVGKKFMIRPIPNDVYNLIFWYYPTCPELKNPDHTIDDRNGFAEYIILDTCIKMVTKEKGDISDFVAKKGEIKQRILNMSASINRGQGDRIQDVYAADYADLVDGVAYGSLYGSGPFRGDY